MPGLVAFALPAAVVFRAPHGPPSPLGFAVLPNVPVPASGDGYVTVSGPRVARPFQVRVRTHTVTWLLLTAS